MFDDDDDDEPDKPVDLNNKDDDYSGGFEDQRTNQVDMDNLMKPCLDFDDNDEESGDAVSRLRPTLHFNLGAKKVDGEEDTEQPEQYIMSKYFSNGESQIDRGHKAKAIFSKRKGNASGYSRKRRYSGDEGDVNTGLGIDKGFDDSDEEDDDLDRESDPLSLEELDGWIKQINMKQSELENTYKPSEPQQAE